MVVAITKKVLTHEQTRNGQWWQRDVSCMIWGMMIVDVVAKVRKHMHVKEDGGGEASDNSEMKILTHDLEGDGGGGWFTYTITGSTFVEAIVLWPGLHHS